ncbi:hypothetical protein NQ318_002573 [Aromia moschata]|uniref:Uncharacterized protein n=1 Tax=Aromia moschata TaxID=1265417 RepID=A0AAV8Y6F2_9CUCU|nr:hypothetical protein NQ318_002573 [Aromia moschata]
MFLLKLHHAPIVANHALLSTLQRMQKLATEGQLKKLRQPKAFNFSVTPRGRGVKREEEETKGETEAVHNGA